VWCDFQYPFNYKFTEESSSEKKLKSVKIRHNYGHESVAPSFWPTLYVSLDDFVYVLCNFVVFGLVASQLAAKSVSEVAHFHRIHRSSQLVQSNDILRGVRRKTHRTT